MGGLKQNISNEQRKMFFTKYNMPCVQHLYPTGKIIGYSVDDDIIKNTKIKYDNHKCWETFIDNGFVDFFNEHIDWRTGNVSVLLEHGRYIVVDLDVNSLKNKNGCAVMSDLFKRYCYDHTQTLIIQTPSKGYHIWFEITEQLAKTIKGLNLDNILPGVDIKHKTVSAPYNIYGGCNTTKNKPHKCGAVDDEHCAFKGKSYIPQHENPIQPLPMFLTKLIMRECKHKKYRHILNKTGSIWKQTNNHTIPSADVLTKLFNMLDPSLSFETKSWRKIIHKIMVLFENDISDARDVIHKFSSNWQFYNETECDAYVDKFEREDWMNKDTSFKSLLSILKKQLGDEKYFISVVPLLDNIDPLDYNPNLTHNYSFIEPSIKNLNVDMKVDKRWIDFIPDLLKIGKDIIGIKSALKTGKTYGLRNVFDYLKELNADKTMARILIVSGRRSLDRELVDKFKRYGFTLYSDCISKSGIITGFRVVVQIDSIAKVQGEFDLMIIDEPKMTLTQVIGMRQKNTEANSDYVVKKDKTAFNAFKTRLRTTPKIITMDAFLDQGIVEQFNIMSSRKMFVVDNAFKPYKGDTCNIHYIDDKDSKEYIERVFDLVKSGKRLVCPMTNKKLADKLKDDLLTAFPNIKILLMTSDTEKLGESEKVKNWGLYDVVIYSPTIMCGVSFDKENIFDITVGYCDNCTITADAMIQMLKRVRHTKSNVSELWVKLKKPKCVLLTSETSFDKYYEDADYKTKQFYDMFNPEIDPIFQKSIIDEYYICARHQRIQRDRDCEYWIPRVIGLLESQGITVEVFGRENLNPKDKKQINQDVSDKLNAECDHDFNEQKRCVYNSALVCLADMPDKLDADLYKSNPEKANITQHQFNKYKFENTYEVKPDIDGLFTDNHTADVRDEVGVRNPDEIVKFFTDKNHCETINGNYKYASAIEHLLDFRAIGTYLFHHKRLMTNDGLIKPSIEYFKGKVNELVKLKDDNFKKSHKWLKDADDTIKNINAYYAGKLLEELKIENVPNTINEFSDELCVKLMNGVLVDIEKYCVIRTRFNLNDTVARYKACLSAVENHKTPSKKNSQWKCGVVSFVIGFVNHFGITLRKQEGVYVADYENAHYYSVIGK